MVFLVLRNKVLKNLDLLSWHQLCGYRRYCNRGLSSVIIRGLQWPRLIISAVHTHPLFDTLVQLVCLKRLRTCPGIGSGRWSNTRDSPGSTSFLFYMWYNNWQTSVHCFPYNKLIGIYFNSLSKQLDMRDSSFGLRRTWNSKKVELAGRVYVGGESEE